MKSPNTDQNDAPEAPSFAIKDWIFVAFAITFMIVTLMAAGIHAIDRSKENALEREREQWARQATWEAEVRE